MTPQPIFPGEGGALERNARQYDAMVALIERLDPVRDADALLAWTDEVVGFATFHHAGRFSDGTIENRLLTVGERLPEILHLLPPSRETFTPPRFAPDGRRTILHVVTTLHGLGGVGRAVPNWITSDPDSRHLLLATRQTGHVVREWVHESIEANGGALILLPPHASLVRKAAWLGEIARTSADLVILHHSCDTVPVVAFATAGGPPVAYGNHPDHAFWIGSTVADIIINFRRIGMELNGQRRHTAADCVLGLPLLPPPNSSLRDGARAKLGIGVDEQALVSVARPEKYRPYGDRNYFATVTRILEQNPAAHVHVVGITLEQAAPHMPAGAHPRLHCVGPLDDPSDYRAAADVYLESFPWGSHTALLEACLAGIPTVPAYAPLTPVLASYDDAIADLVTNPASEQEYIDRANVLLRNADARARLGDLLRTRVLASHVGRGWQERAHRVYESALKLPHRPSRIPRESCSRTDVDVALSAWLDTQRVFAPGGSAVEWLHREVGGVAYTLRERRDYKGALRLLRESDSLWGRGAGSLQAMAKLIPHWIYRHVTGVNSSERGWQS